MTRAAAVKVELHGPLFSADVNRVFGKNLVDMLEATAAEQASEVEKQITSHASSMPYYTGWTAGTIVGRVHAIGGKQWHRNAVVSANTSGMSRKDAIRTKAAAATIEARWHPFRKVKSASYRAVKNANLTKGLE